MRSTEPVIAGPPATAAAIWDAGGGDGRARADIFGGLHVSRWNDGESSTQANWSGWQPYGTTIDGRLQRTVQQWPKRVWWSLK